MKKTIKRLSAILLTVAMLMACVSVFAMAKQVQITEKTPLLKKDGSLTQPGYCYTDDLYQYDRAMIGAPGWRIKEWDFYQVSNERYCMQITIADISLGGAVTVGCFDMKTGKAYSTMILDLFTNGKFTSLSKGATTPHHYSFQKKNFNFEMDITKEKRVIKFTGKAGSKPFNVDMTLDMLPNHESYVAAFPFKTKDNQHFYFNQKTNCMAANGTITVGDDVKMEFKGLEDNSFCVLDWGRGVWPFHETWWWGNGSVKLDTGDILGWEIGWGFGDLKDVSESCLFLNGKGYKIGYLKLENEDDIVKPLSSDWVKKGKGMKWVVKSYEDEACTIPNEDFNMEMTPVYDNYTMMRVICVGNLCHQVFGKWNGTVKVGDKVIEVKDAYAFLERSDNMW